MTATPPVDRAAASRLVAAQERAWTAIRTRHPEVPEVVIVVASGSDPRSRRLKLGHFAAGRWQLTDQPSDRAEVLVSGEGLQRGPIDVLGTLLHEAAHGLAYARKLSDTSRQGSYHNRRLPPWPARSAWTWPTSSRLAGRRPPGHHCGWPRIPHAIQALRITRRVRPLHGRRWRRLVLPAEARSS